ncbi:lecithin retinol acyltransferase family protein [Pseudomonas sp. JS3066]|uniref:lecithin retinol acyltransferase family protein n=1 Tax=Pseudomonas sp. JS3066 TaxID=3090665 RepID=UPI002E7BCE80|nr:lecithin retinol acyltransferase family protein [Pseudomonas sp. JS3066]WVK92413.1 lecithin retinol acyltransferase family protein [Pseudomonas sp. JS3066]
MRHFTDELADSFNALRSALFVCLTLLTTRITRQLNALMPERKPFAKSRGRGQLANSAASSLFRLEDIKQGASSLPVGSHLISPRTLYAHHGIYLGGGNVVHYSGFASSIKPGPVEVTDLECFANGHDVWIVQEQCRYSSDEIASRARSRVGESQYRLLSNNCEHFCNWCISGESYSSQINACLHFPRHVFSLISESQTSFI